MTLQWILFHLDDFTLASLDIIASNLRSAIIPLALWKDHLDLEQAIHAARIEEEHQQSVWGEVEGSHDLERVTINIRVAAGTFFLQSLPQKELPL